jgi:hypothetical protein
VTERGSDKTSPRVDDELRRETEPLERGAPAPSRAEEHRQAEAPGDGEPGPDARPGDTADDSEARVELARHLRPSAFPADRQRLMAVAREEHAPDAVLRELERLPKDGTFETPQDVWEALGETSAGR